MKKINVDENSTNKLSGTDPYVIASAPEDLEASGRPDHVHSLDPSMNALKHGAAGYERDGRLPVEWEGYDRELARELLSFVGGVERFSLACMLAARRATLVEMAFSWLAKEDVDVFWVEVDEKGRSIVRFQPVLTRLFGWMNGLMRDLAALNLTPAQAAGLMPDEGILDAGKILEVVRNEQD